MDRQSRAWSLEPLWSSASVLTALWDLLVGASGHLCCPDLSTYLSGPDKALALCCSKEEQLGLVRTLSWTEAELWGCPGIEL